MNSNTRLNTVSRVVAAACLVVAVVLPISKVSAVTLAPGGGLIYPVPGEPDPVPGTSPLFTTNVLWGSSYSFFGSLTSSVFDNDTSNPWYSQGGLTFTYELTIDVNSPHSASGLTVGGFSIFQADVSFQVPTTGTSPFFVTRSQESPGVGQNIAFHFFPYVPPGGSSALLVIQTDAQSWDYSIASVINSSAYPNIFTVAPVNVVPEPSAAAIILIGLLTTGYFRRKQA